MMVISSRGRYSLRILVLMASGVEGRVFTKHEIAELEEVPYAYLQQLMITLRAAGLVYSHRGRTGGFTLARTAETITVGDVLRATEGQTALAPCLGSEKCEREPGCPTRPLWMRATEMLDGYFAGVTVAELVRGSEPLSRRGSLRSALGPVKAK